MFGRTCALLEVSLSGLSTRQWERVLCRALRPKGGAAHHRRGQILRRAGREWEYGEPEQREGKTATPALGRTTSRQNGRGGDFFNHDLVLAVALACWLAEKVLVDIPSVAPVADEFWSPSRWNVGR
jgi:hypothetical protein